MARNTRYSEEQILKVLAEIDAGATIVSVARTHGVGVQTIYEWRKRYAGMSKSELTAMKTLQEENRRLKNLVAELSLDNAALKELQRENGKPREQTARCYSPAWPGLFKNVCVSGVPDFSAGKQVCSQRTQTRFEGKSP